MTRQVIDRKANFLPTQEAEKAIDDNFVEVYASIASIGDGTGNSLNLAEYANNTAAAVDLEVGDLYTTTGTVKVVTA